MLVVERVVQTAEILAADRDGDAGRAGRLGRQLIEVFEAPGPGRKQRLVSLAKASTAAARPDRKDERKGGPPLPLLTEIVAVLVRSGRRERERRVANDEHSFMGQAREQLEILGFGARLRKLRPDRKSTRLNSSHLV